jgi:hypothetical protein
MDHPPIARVSIIMTGVTVNDIPDLHCPLFRRLYLVLLMLPVTGQASLFIYSGLPAV